MDGQQRLTSLFAVLKGIPVVREDFRKERIRIAFRPKDSLFEVADAATGRDPEYVAGHQRTLGGIGDAQSVRQGLPQAAPDHREVSDEEEDHISEAIGRLSNLQEYPFTAHGAFLLDERGAGLRGLRADQQQGQVAEPGRFRPDPHVRLLGQGADPDRGLLPPSRPPSTGPPPLQPLLRPDADHLLRVSVALGFRRARLQYVYSLLRGKDLDTGEFSDAQREKQFAILKKAQAETLDLQNWHEFFKVLIRAGYRRGDLISSQINLLYSYALLLIGRKEFGVDLYRLRNVMARWFFMSSLTSRYTGSPESVMKRTWRASGRSRPADQFVAHLDRITQDALADDYWAITLPNELATSSARSPSLVRLSTPP